MFFQGSIAEAMQRSELLSWPLLLFVAKDDDVQSVKVMVGAAQLDSVSLMQLLVVGTPQHQQFQALVAEQDTPRVHIFAPKRCRVNLPPMSLVGEHFTAEKLGEAVDLASEWADAYVQELTRRLGQEAELVGKEATRFWKATEYEQAQKKSKPLFGKEAAVSQQGAGTGNSGRKQHADPHGNAHDRIAHYVELSVDEKIQVIFQTDPNMTLATLWDMADAKRLALGRDDEELQQSVLAELKIKNPNSEVVRHIKSRDAAASEQIADLVSKSLVIAVFRRPELVAQRPPKDGCSAAADETADTIVCDGDVCRRVPVSGKRDKEVDVAKGGPASASPSALKIAVRCQLPDGKQVTVEDLAPHSVLEDVRVVVEQRLGHSSFWVYNSYPPKRFAEEDMTKSLLSLGLDRNAAVRIVMNASLSDGEPRSNTTQPLGATGGVQGLVGQSVGRLSGLLRNVAGALAGGGANPQRAEAGQQPQANVEQGSGGIARAVGSRDRPRFATLSSISRSGEESSQDPSNDGKDNPRKNNRYFGGTSTEFEGK